jgi:hypothetical protein
VTSVIEAAEWAAASSCSAARSSHAPELDWRSGRILDAERDTRRAIELPPSDGAERPHAICQLTDALIEQARVEEAEALLTPRELARHDPESILFQALRASHAGC